MSDTLHGLEPRRLWHHFERLCRVPHCSGNETAALELVMDSARELGLDYRQDGAGNVLVVKPALPGREQGAPVVVQSHLDMVCEKNEDSGHDFASDPLVLKREGEWLKAENTSLGADNGIGAAAMLALMEEEGLRCGSLELLFTVEEETGLTGAMSLEPGSLKGRLLVNLDTEESGTVYIGCAGGRDSDITLPLDGADPGLFPEDAAALRVRVTGLRGGHSGGEIHLGRGNAIKILAAALHGLGRRFRLAIADIHGGDKHNAIPREASAVVLLPQKQVQAFGRALEVWSGGLAEEYREADPGFRFHAEETGRPRRVFDPASSAVLLRTLVLLPHGVLAMSGSMGNLVETSSNVSSIRTRPDGVLIHASHRSSRQESLDQTAALHRYITDLVGGVIRQDRGYPAWTPDPQSPLLSVARRAIRSVTGREASVRAIHAGLECGVIKAGFPGMDAVSIGPTITGPHSPHERVHIPSVGEFYLILREILSSAGQASG